ncbi:MAG: hypothetical protein J2O49_02570, partial [Sciscionella sp.]|nr:hypothetical protein [Sciscionella sp.]
LADAARADVATAKAISAGKPSPVAAAVAKARQQQANALQAEIDRARGGSPSSRAAPPSTSKPPADQASALNQLDGSLKIAQQKAAALVPTLPRYRAGLVGSVAAGCASLRELFS